MTEEALVFLREIPLEDRSDAMKQEMTAFELDLVFSIKKYIFQTCAMSLVSFGISKIFIKDMMPLINTDDSKVERSSGQNKNFNF